MKDIILFSAITIDGYIAKSDGNLDWLFEFDKTNDEAEKIFQRFYSSIDTTFIGNKTFKQILSSGNPTPYHQKTNYVFSTHDHDNTDNVTYVKDNIEAFIVEQKARPGKNIWLVGGGQLNNLFYELGQIDQIILDIIPVILGQGIPLLSRGKRHQFYTQEVVQQYPSGRIQIQYRKRRKQ
ncbi:MAG: dihydrofolate reductase family protein [Ardenticatenaceae bacterium]|nr:dihydrofolate reductase family protein [Ardenticatenaceae bacterium]